MSRHRGYFRRAGEEVAVAHPFDEPDAATVFDIDLETMSQFDAHDWSSGCRPIDPSIAFKHRLLRKHLDDAVDNWRIEETALGLISEYVGFDRQPRSQTASDRRRLKLVWEVADEIEFGDRDLTLVELARSVGCSPFHLSRTFRALTGYTITQYRTRYRVNEVLHRLDAGADDLSRVAAECGFADHGHMTRTVSSMLGQTPSRIRELLRRAG